MNTLFVLYLITNLGASFTFELKGVVAIYKTERSCEIHRIAKETLLHKDSNGVLIHRLECKPEDYFE